MFQNNLKIAFRNLLKNKGYSFINITGLAVGLTCFILVILYVRYEFSYESHHKNAENIYRVNVIHHHPKGEYKISSSMVPLGKTLAEKLPEIKDFTRIENAGKTLVTYRDKKFIENNMCFADQGIFHLFSVPPLSGKMESALMEKYSVVMTESMAEKYFGQEDPLGKTLLLDNEDAYTVTAVIKDFPENTNLSPEFLISFNTLNDIAGEDFMNNWVTNRLLTYVLLPDNRKISALEKKINEVTEAHSSTEVKRTLELEQFSRIHLYSEVSSSQNIQYIYIFLNIGILILVIASINFMNLSTARSARRANEVGLRKVVGANRWQLIKQFLGESILTSFVAFIFSLVLVNIALPLFKNLTDQKLFFPAPGEWHFYGMLFAITLAVGFLSGSYPALYLSAFSPIRILKRKQSSRGKDANLRRALVVLQFGIAIALIIVTLSISNQLNFMRNKGLGFQKDQIVVVPVNGGEFRENIAPFKKELLNHSNIGAVAGSILLPSKIGMYNNVTWEGAAKNESISLIQNKIDYDFLDTYEIEVIQGRNFSPEYPSDIIDPDRENISGAVILNEEAVRRFGWENPIGKKVIQVFGEERYNFNVVGVIKDFHFASLHTKIQPLSLFLRTNYPRNISIKIKPGDMQNSIAHIQDTWSKFNPEYPFEYYFIDETFDRTYQSEAKLQTLFGYFSLLSIFISCLGLFGLAAFAAERRTKEIGVRKVLGATVSNIVFLLSKEFTMWILIANIVAWPVAFFAMNSWLQNFAYRTEIGWEIFIISGLAALVIALSTVSFQAIKAALANPINALKYE